MMRRQPTLRKLDEADTDGGDEDGDGSDAASRGSGFRLVLLPTILLGSAFTLCVVCRYCRQSGEDLAFNQVEEYLSSFDDDDTASAVELRSDVYSEDDAASRTSSRGSSQPREPSFPRSTSTQAEEGEIA